MQQKLTDKNLNEAISFLSAFMTLLILSNVEWSQIITKIVIISIIIIINYFNGLKYSISF